MSEQKTAEQESKERRERADQDLALRKAQLAVHIRESDAKKKAAQNNVSPK
jgi:hypothetical protein